MDSIHDIIKLPPLEKRKTTTSVQVHEFEKKYGPIPDDYKSYLFNIGHGMIGKYLVLFSPHIDWEIKMELCRESFQMAIEEKMLPENFFNDKLVFGATIDNHWLFFDFSQKKTEIVILDCMDKVHRYHGGLYTFLVCVLNRPDTFGFAMNRSSDKLDFDVM